MYDMNILLNNYEPGRPENKQDVLKQIKVIEDKRKKRLDDINMMLDLDKKMSSFYENDINIKINEYENKLSDKNIIISELLKRIKQLTTEVEELKKYIKS